MAISQTNLVIQHLRRFVLLRDAVGLTDEQLLESFINRRDELAFEVLVRRHGAMVMGVCRRVLHSHHDAEDAFQATFLVLARKAAALAARGLVANWLYGVAYNTALKAKAAAARRRDRERETADMSEPAAPAPNPWPDLQALLDQEFSRLPDKYRAAVVLCDLEGKSRKEAAEQIGCPEGTVASRLAQGRTLLAKRLTNRGVALSAAALTGEMALNAASANGPTSLIATTSNAAILYAAGQAVTGVVSIHVAALAEGALKAMILTKLKTMAVAALVLGLVAVGGDGLFTLCATAPQNQLALIAGAQNPIDNPAQPDRPAPNDPPKPVVPEKAKGQERGEAESSLDPKAILREAAQGAARMTKSVFQHYDLATIAVEQAKIGDRKAADESFSVALLAANPLDDAKKAAQLSYLSWKQAEAGDINAAGETAEKLVKFPSERALAWGHIAAIQAEAGELKSALVTAGKVTEKDSEYGQYLALAAIAVAQAKSGDTQQAIETAESLPYISYRVECLGKLAILRQQAGQKDSQEILDRAVAAAKEVSPTDLGWLAKVYVIQATAQMGQLPEAIQLASQFEQLKGDFRNYLSRALVAIATEQVKAKDIQGALKTARSIRRDVSRDEAMVTIASAQSVADAFATLNEIKYDYHRAQGIVAIARRHVAAGQKQQAEATFQKAYDVALKVTDFPQHIRMKPGILRDLARAQGETGFGSAARNWINRLESPEDRVMALLGLAQGLSAKSTQR